MAFRMRWPTQYEGITQRFGANPHYYAKFGLPGHEGLDFVASAGSEIYAVADGLVSDVRLDGLADPMAKPYGNQVRIQHTGGYETIYAHLSDTSVVRGQPVKAGQVIGLAGGTGNATGPHLHLSLKKFGATERGETIFPYDLIDPTPYLEPYDRDGNAPPEPPEAVTMVVTVACATGGRHLNVRAAPHVHSAQLGRVDDSTLLGALEPPAVVLSKVGQPGQWLWVRTPEGLTGYVAAWYLMLPETNIGEPPVLLEVQVERPDEHLRLRAGPGTHYDELERLLHGTVVTALGSQDRIAEKVGQDDAWIQVQAPSGLIGYVAAWYVRLVDEVPANLVFVLVDCPNADLKLRAGPGSAFDVVARLPHGTVLRALDAPDAVAQKVGRRACWIKVMTPEGQLGFVAARYVQIKPFSDKPVIPEPSVGLPTAHVVVESAGVGLRLRAGPGTEHARTYAVPHGTVLTSLEDPAETGRKVGRRDAWIHVRTPAHETGYAAAWYVRHPEQEDLRGSATTDDLPAGVAPHIFGIHAVAVAEEPHARDRIQDLYHSAGKRGWVLFTEIVGRHPETMTLNPKIRQRLWDWADAGYGVIIRLDHGYAPGGTLPEMRFHDDYAAAVARWVELYLKDEARPYSSYAWTIQIGNEQNNPCEHPGGAEEPLQHITPEIYADAFNRTYTRVKRVLPNAIVCPGALDPYNYMPWRNLGGRRWRPLDYFSEMLERIEALDGISLHAYTHGPWVEAVTHLKRFGDGTGPLGDHYYDFQLYRLFMERIPSEWRDVPAYITEISHIHRPCGAHDKGWVNQNLGWIQAVYEEIDRWNRQPYAQQIRCGLIYRWMWDAWAIENKPDVLKDFRAAMAHDYRWRTAPGGRPTALAMPALAPTAQPEELEERFLVQPDNLTEIWGLGDKAMKALNAGRVMLFEQLARMTPSELEVLIGEIGLRTRHLETWPEQARLAAARDWEALSRYRESLTMTPVNSKLGEIL